MFDRISVFLFEGVAIAVFTVSLIIYSYQNKIIYPRDYPHGSREHVWKPGEFNMTEYEDLRINTTDNVSIHAYYIPYIPQKKETSEDKHGKFSPVTLVYCHANSGNMGHRLSLVKEFRDNLHVNVLIFSYRGYGLSGGSPSERGIKTDIDSVFKYINQTPNIRDTKLIIFGQSLGGAVAIYGASTAPPNLKMLIVENTFYNLKRLCSELMPQLYYTFSLLISEKWSSNEIVTKIPNDIPVLFVCGSDDKLVNKTHSNGLYKLISDARNSSDYNNTAARVSLLEMPGGHNDTCTSAEYINKIREFVLQEFPDLRNI